MPTPVPVTTPQGAAACQRRWSRRLPRGVLYRLPRAFGVVLVLALLLWGPGARSAGDRSEGELAIRVTVLDRAGARHDQLRLQLFRKENGRYQACRDSTSANASARSFRNLAAGDYRLDVRPWEGDNLVGSVAFRLAPSPDGAPLALTLKVRPAPVLTVTVQDRTGQPVPGAEVSIYPLENWRHNTFKGTTNDEGVVQFLDLRAGTEYKVYANHGDLTSSPGEYYPIQRFEMRPGLALTCTVHKVVFDRLKVRFVGPDGQAVPTAMDVFMGDRRLLLYSDQWLPSIEEGTFVPRNLLSTAGWHLTQDQAPVTLDRDMAEGVLELQVRRSVAVQIVPVGLDDEPLQRPGLCHIDALDYSSSWGERVRLVDSLAGKRAEIPPFSLPVGDFHLTLAIQGYQRTTVPLRVPALGRYQVHTVRVPMRLGHCLTGTVTGPPAAAADAKAADPVVGVSVRQSLGLTASAPLEDGVFTLCGLSREPMELQLEYASGARYWTDLAADALDASPLTVAAPPTYPVALTFEVGDQREFHTELKNAGSPCGYLYVVRNPARRQLVASLPFQLTGTHVLRLPPGEYRLLWLWYDTLDPHSDSYLLGDLSVSGAMSQTIWWDADRSLDGVRGW